MFPVTGTGFPVAQMVMSLIYVTNAILEINSEKRKTGILRKNSMWERAAKGSSKEMKPTR